MQPKQLTHKYSVDKKQNRYNNIFKEPNIKCLMLKLVSMVFQLVHIHYFAQII